MSVEDPDDQTLFDDYYGPITPDWVPTETEASELRTIVVPVTTLLGDPLYGKLRGVPYPQGDNSWFKFVYYTPQTGAPLQFSVGSYSTPPAVQVKYREATGLSPTVYIPDEGDEPSLATDGTYVLLPVPIELKNCPGIYRAQTRVLKGDGTEAARDEFLVYIQRGMWLANGESPVGDQGPPTINEVRTALRDHPAANRLLGSYEFDAAEIAQALVAAVQDFGQEFPQMHSRINTVSFPIGWRLNWLDGARAHLFETAAAYCRRGTLPYAAGGVSINDLAKEKEYLTAAQIYRERFTRWMRIKKAEISIAGAWGSQGSGIPSGRGYW